MRNISIPTTAMILALAVSAPAFAQTETAPAADPAVAPVTAPVAITAPEGYVTADIGTVTADDLKGVDVYDPAGNEIAEIADIEIGSDTKVTHIITDVGGFLGIGEHRVALTPDQIMIYKNADNDLRAYVTATKDALKALPAYVEPNG